MVAGEGKQATKLNCSPGVGFTAVEGGVTGYYWQQQKQLLHSVLGASDNRTN